MALVTSLTSTVMMAMMMAPFRLGFSQLRQHQQTKAFGPMLPLAFFIFFLAIFRESVILEQDGPKDRSCFNLAQLAQLFHHCAWHPHFCVSPYGNAVGSRTRDLLF